MAHAAAYTTADATAACSAVAVVIPCYKVATHILPLLARIGPEVAYIIVVDDACPEGSGDVVKARCTDPRVEVVFHPRNLGVGARLSPDINVRLHAARRSSIKLDGDGQMDPAFATKLRGTGVVWQCRLHQRQSLL